MLAKRKEFTVLVHTWDWKDSPDFNLLFKTIKEKNILEPNFTEAETGSDQLCVVVTEKRALITPHEATRWYQSYYNDSCDENGSWEIIE